MKKVAVLVALMLILNACSDDDSSSDKKCTQTTCPNGRCVNDQCLTDPVECTQDICKDEHTLLKCSQGVSSEMPCGGDELCSGNACVKQSSTECTQDICKDEHTLLKCSQGVSSEMPCGGDELCSGNACVKQSSTECTADECIDETGTSNRIRVCTNGVFQETTCSTGQVCEGGGCMDAFTLDEKCTDPDGFGKCTADGKHAIVCFKNEITRFTCAEACQDGEEGIVNCPKKANPPTYDECDPKTYRATCINNNANVQVCVKRQIVLWDCYNNICSVDENNEIFCPADAVAAGEGGLEFGGSYGDVCNAFKYQESCIDDYYALICDVDNKVRIKPARDCKISADNPLKVDYDPAGTECDVELTGDISKFAPFCINHGQAIGFCGYVDDTHTSGIYKAAQCLGCDSDERAIECMYE